MLNLYNFEDLIEPMILDRGYSIFLSSNFDSAYKTSNLDFEFKYTGTEMYKIKVELSDELDIIHSWCTCPYDYSEFCKHEVATFYYLSEHLEQVPFYHEKKESSIIQGSMEELIHELSGIELKNILKTISIEEVDFKNAIYNYQTFSKDITVLKFINALQHQSRKHSLIDILHPKDECFTDYVFIMNALLKENKTEEFFKFYLKVNEILEKEMLYSTDRWRIQNYYRQLGKKLKNLFKLYLDEIENFNWLNYFEDKLDYYTEEAIFTYIINYPITKENFEQANYLCKNWINKTTNKDDIINYAEFIVGFVEEDELLKFYRSHLDVNVFQIKVINILKDNKSYAELVYFLENIDKDYGLSENMKTEMFNALYHLKRFYDAFSYADEKIKDGSTFMFDYLKEVLDPPKFKEISEKYATPYFYENDLHIEVYGKALVEHDRLETLYVLLEENKYYIPMFQNYFDDEMLFELYLLFITNIVSIPGRRNYKRAADRLRDLKLENRANVAERVKNEIINLFPNRPALVDEFSRIDLVDRNEHSIYY